MQTTPTNLAFFFTGLQNSFWQAWGVTDAFADRLATTVPSGTEQEGYVWIGMVDKMRLWTGSRTVHTPGLQTYFLINQPYELTESVDKFKLLDDTWGSYGPLATFMGMQSKKLWDYQLRDLVENLGAQIGTLQNGLDGLPHWNTAHPVDFYDSTKGTYANDFTGGGFSVGGINVGGPLAVNAYATVRQEMLSRKSESGEPLGVLPDLMWGPTQIDATARQILQTLMFSPATHGTPSYGGATNLVGVSENVLRGTADWLMIPEFGVTTQANANSWWYLGDTSKPIKPFIKQVRQAANFVYRIVETDPVVFDAHTYIYGVDQRGALGWGPAFLSSRSGV